MANWFITGVSTGLGRALAEAALTKGDTVVGTLRSADQVTAFDLFAPGRAHGVLMDVTDEEMVRDAIGRAERLTGGLDVVVNNAGRGLTGAIEETSLDEARALFEVNIFGPLAVIRAALPYLRSRKSGHIVNITSVSGLAAWAGTGIYGASKFALECIGRTLAQELEPLGIHVTNVAPGGLRTEFAGETLAEGTRNDRRPEPGKSNLAAVGVGGDRESHARGDPGKEVGTVGEDKERFGGRDFPPFLLGPPKRGPVVW